MLEKIGFNKQKKESDSLKLHTYSFELSPPFLCDVYIYHCPHWLRFESWLQRIAPVHRLEVPKVPLFRRVVLDNSVEGYSYLNRLVWAIRFVRPRRKIKGDPWVSLPTWPATSGSKDDYWGCSLTPLPLSLNLSNNRKRF